jgi:branched-chain amino acid transport system permease protein
MTFFLQLAVSGLATGMVFALIAMGFVVILKCSGAFNIAQGYLVMIGSYLGYSLLVTFQLPIWASLIGAVLVAIVLGMIIERFTIRPLLGKPVLAIIMMTIAMSSVLEGIATLVWGGQYKTYHNIIPSSFTLRFGDISLPPESLIGLIVSLLIVIILLLFFRYTKIGLAMRGTAEDEQIVRSMGIKVNMVYVVSWIIACITAFIAGILLGAVSGAFIPIATVGLEAFAVVLLGGIDSIVGAVVAGIIVGILQNLAAGYLDPLIPGGQFAGVFPFFVIIIVLIFRPYGLFGLKRIERI